MPINIEDLLGLGPLDAGQQGGGLPLPMPQPIGPSALPVPLPQPIGAPSDARALGGPPTPQQQPMLPPIPPQVQRQPEPQGSGRDLVMQLIPLVMAAFQGRKDPTSAAALLQGTLRGQQMAQAERLDAQQRDDEQRQLHAKWMQSVAADAQQFSDPVEHQRYLDFAEQVSESMGLPRGWTRSIAFPKSKAAAAKKAKAEAKLKALQARYGDQFQSEAVQTATISGDPDFDGLKVKDIVALAGLQLTDAAGKTLAPTVNPLPGSLSNQEGAVKVLIDAFTEQHGRPPNAAERRTLYFDAQREMAGITKPGSAPNVGSFEDYVIRYAKAKGVEVDALSPAQIEDARKRYQQSDDRPRVTVTTGNLPTPVARRANQLADAFAKDKTVQRVNTQAEAYAFVQSLSNTSESPADDQALIYAFAKAMDPESVVREGEYATVQKYAESWVRNLGFNAKRILESSEFLSPKARRQMKETIRQKYAAGRTQYANIRRQYANQINRVTGQTDGDDYLLDYAGAHPSPDGATAKPPAGATPPKPRGANVKWSKSLNAWVEVTGTTPDGKPIVKVVK